ncbi:MAG: DUF3105 domain-containing protein [Dehalococcoidia bacterium]
MIGGISLAVIFIAALMVSPGLTPQNTPDNGFNRGGPVPGADTDGGAAHVVPGQAHDGYSIVPATSGPHWQVLPDTSAGSLHPYGAPARWGFYDDVLPDEVLVHNLEHGGIGLHYDCSESCPEVVQELKDLIPSNPSAPVLHSQFIVSPYPDMPAKIAITAWRKHMYLEEVDRERILEFIQAYRNRAPESVPGNMF